MSSSILSILRIVGSDKASSSLLKEALVNHFRQKQLQEVEDPHDNDRTAVLSSSSHVISVRNRYFQASVLLLLDPYEAIEELVPDSLWIKHDDDDDETKKNHPKLFQGKEDGLILVLDEAELSTTTTTGEQQHASNTSSCTNRSTRLNATSSVVSSGLGGNSHWHDLHEQYSGQAGELLRLCVSVVDENEQASSYPKKGTKEYEERYSERVLWCLDREYEYVEASLEQKALETGHDERDKDGFARVVEAISGTVWSSAVMIDSKKQQALKKNFVNEYANTETIETTEERESEYVPPDLVEREELAKAEILNQCNIKEEDKEAGEERKLEELENALREATRIRDLSRSGSLTDEQRRERAGEAATLLMNIMGQFGDESESSEEEATDY